MSDIPSDFACCVSAQRICIPATKNVGKPKGLWVKPRVNAPLRRFKRPTLPGESEFKILGVAHGESEGERPRNINLKLHDLLVVHTAGTQAWNLGF